MKRIFSAALIVTAILYLSPSSEAGISRGGESNTNQGVDALHDNSSGTDNSAFGYAALSNNTTGTQNTAIGSSTLSNATTANNHTAVGYLALFRDTSGEANTAVGAFSMSDNTDGSFNTAVGLGTLQANITGIDNVAAGALALRFNTTGSSNTGDGRAALRNNTTGSANTAVGFHALFNNNGNRNIAIGRRAGDLLDIGDDNIEIGNEGNAGEADTIRLGDPAVQNATYIAGIFGSSTIAPGMPVYVDANGKLGTLPSSARFKENVKPMNDASDEIFSLQPVTFRYKADFTKEKTPQFGLIAEEVAKVDPNLIVRDAKGQIETVRYEAVNAMMLNELIKEHQKVQDQQKQIDKLTAQLKAQASALQKVSAQVELMKTAPKTVADSR